MNYLSRRDPFREMFTLRNAMDRMFDNFLMGPEEWTQQAGWGFPLDVSENEDEFLVKASLPGVKPDDLEITYNNNTLTIKGEVKAEEEREGDHYHLHERRYGTFSRSITLPTSVDPDKIKANYDSGILTLHIPKAEEARPKRIQIQSGQQKVIEPKVGEGK